MMGFCLREAFAGLWRRRGTAVPAVLATTVALGVFGVFLALVHNLQPLVTSWAAAAEFSVYLRDDITPEQRAALNRTLAETDLVAGRTYVSKADALARFQHDFPDLASSVTALPSNPLPASIDVRLSGAGTASDAVESLATRVRLIPGVADVRFDRRWLSRLSTLVAAANWAVGVLAAALALAAALTVASVVRLSLYARRDEVEIMQLMGAPVLLLRGPLVLEGVLHGLLGGVLALAGVQGALVLLRVTAATAFPVIVEAGLLNPLPVTLVSALLLAGALVGCIGGLSAARDVR